MEDPLDAVHPCKFVDLRPDWGSPLLHPHGHRLHQCRPECPEAIFRHPSELHRCGPYCSQFIGPLKRISGPPLNPSTVEFVLGRCPRCRGRIVQRLWAIVVRRGAKVAVQVHNCIRCWEETSRYTERI